MPKKVPLEQLASSIDKILKDYADGVIVGMDEVTKKIAQKGAKAVGGEAKARGWGHDYDTGWTSQLETTRFGVTATIYNKNKAGLAHLLEKGHAKRNGGRTRAFPHIAPVETDLQDEYYNAVRDSI